jgi:hypothetical protein
LGGGRVEVRWRTTAAPLDAGFIVSATETREEHKDRLPASDVLVPRARRAHRIVLEGAQDKRWVHVRIIQFAGDRTQTVRVRLR